MINFDGGKRSFLICCPMNGNNQCVVYLCPHYGAASLCDILVLKVVNVTYPPDLPTWPIHLTNLLTSTVIFVRVFYSGFNFWYWWSTWVATENRQTRPSCPTWNSSSVRSSLYSDEVSFSFGLWHIKDMLLCDTWQITRLAEHNFHSNSFDERESFCRWQLLQLNSCELQ